MTTAPTRRSLVPRSYIIAGVVIVALIAGAITAGVLWSQSRMVLTPDVTGLPQEIAERALSVLDLETVVTGTRVSVDVPQGAVISQDPLPGQEMRRGDPVSLVLSAGPQTFLLPDVIGMPLDAARDDLVSEGLVVNVVTVSSEASEGVVVEMFPAPGSSVNTGDEVRLSVPAGSDGTDDLLPYDLSGLSLVIDPAPPAESAESDPALEVARRLSSLLQAAGASVTMSRSATDTAPAPAERLETASSSGATVLVGIDVGDTGDAGLRVLTPAAGAVPADVFARAASLAAAITRSSRLPGLLVLEPATSADLVLTGFDGLGVRVVVGDSAAEADRARMADPAWADSVARALYRGIGIELASD